MGEKEGKCVLPFGRQRMRWLDDITDSMDMKLSKLQVLVMDRKDWHVAVHCGPKGWTQLSGCTELKLNAAYVFHDVSAL